MGVFNNNAIEPFWFCSILALDRATLIESN